MQSQVATVGQGGRKRKSLTKEKRNRQRTAPVANEFVQREECRNFRPVSELSPSSLTPEQGRVAVLAPVVRLEKQMASPSKLVEVAKIDVTLTELQQRRQEILASSGKKSHPGARQSAMEYTSRALVKLNKVTGSKQRSSGRLNDFCMDSCAPVASNSSGGSFLCDDPLSVGTWKHSFDIPPYEVNSRDEPIGEYWNHMSKFCFERAACIFPWHVAWSKQDVDFKRRFLKSLRQLYPEEWCSKYVMKQVGNNLKEKRVRLRRSFRNARQKECVPCSGGCTLESWNLIFESLSDANLEAKTEKCKVAVDARTKRLKFTHKLGAHGVGGLVNKFVSILAT
jgi:hypothetical protein